MGPPDSLFGLVDSFNKDAAVGKINLSIGAYRDDSNKPFVLPSVRKAEQKIHDLKLNHEYAGIDGVADFVQQALRFCYGPAFSPERTAGVQTISGTGALRLGAELLARFKGRGFPIYLPSPTWPNHIPIMKDAGLEV